MFARVVNFTGVGDIDGGIRYGRDTVAPLLRQQHGYRGVSASVDRAGAAFGFLSLWDTEADREVSESAMAKARAESLKITGGQVTVELYEEMVSRMARPPFIGAALLIRRVSMDPAKVDENLEYFTREVVPAIEAGQGFVALRHMINRQTGDGVVSTLWTDTAALEAAAEAAMKRQQAAAGRVTFREQSRREVVLIDMP